MKNEEKKKALSNHIYNVAIGLFCTFGYKQIKLVDIAQAAEVSTRTLHKYYPTKDSILKRFTRENILEVQRHAREDICWEMSLFDIVVDLLIYDYKQMFCLFDVGYILDTSLDEKNLLHLFEIENVTITEETFAEVFATYQIEKLDVMNDRRFLCSSIVVGIMRHCNDLYRFREKAQYKEDVLRELYVSHLEVVWNSLLEYLLTDKHLNNEKFNSYESLRSILSLDRCCS